MSLRNILFLIVVLAIILFLGLSYFVWTQVGLVYGADNRHNYFEASSNERLVAQATALRIRKSKVTAAANAGFYELPGDPPGYCAGERFADEPSSGDCTGFRVGASTIATAGHCVRGREDCDGVAWIFGFRKNSQVHANPEIGINGNNIYFCRRYLPRLNQNTGEDWALVELDRPITGNIPTLKLAANVSLGSGDLSRLTVVGYPDGLPVKITRNAKIRDVQEQFFVMNSDTFGGNSGSPVLKESNIAQGVFLVEGILVRGDVDFTLVEGATVNRDGSASPGKCKKVVVCEEDGCAGPDGKTGEDAMHAAPVRAALNSFLAVEVSPAGPAARPN